MNETRTGLLETLHEMGAQIELLDLRHQGGEPVGPALTACGKVPITPRNPTGDIANSNI
jgi:hypothetical protein